jgi:uncharacterized protein YndB with AHSA1/START domain
VIDDRGCVVHDVRFPYPIDRVWAALTDRAALAQWLMPNDFEPRVGHRFRFEAGPPRGDIDAEVLVLDSPTRMELRWMLDGVATTVTFRLTADGDGTLLHLEHARIGDSSRAQFDGGWVEKFDALARVLKETP